MIMRGTFRVACLVFIAFILTSCARQTPIPVGFSAELTGKRGELGVDARDSALLTVEFVNQNRGINGRPIDLIVMDDQGNPEITRQNDTDLIE